MKPYHYIIIILTLLLIFSIQQVFDQNETIKENNNKIENLKKVNQEASERVEIVYDTIQVEIEKQEEIIKKDKEDEKALINLNDTDSIYKLFSKYYPNNEKPSETSD